LPGKAAKWVVQSEGAGVAVEGDGNKSDTLGEWDRDREGDKDGEQALSL